MSSSRRSRDRRQQAPISGGMESIAKQIGARSFSSTQDIVRYFHALGTAAPSEFGWEFGKLFGIVNLPPEARKLGIDSPRQIAEGLAVKQLDTPQQMQLAMAAFDAGAQSRVLDRRQPLTFENRRIAALAGQKVAATEMKMAARTLKYDKDLSNEEVVDIAYRWGKAAKRLGLDFTIQPKQLSEREDQIEAEKFGLTTPPQLAEGAMLGKIRKGEASPAQFLLFQQAFDAGVNGAAKPQAALPQVANNDISGQIRTASLQGAYRDHVKSVEDRFEAGLRAVEQVGLARGNARQSALHQAEAHIAHYAAASLALAGSLQLSPRDELPDRYQKKIKDKLAEEDAATQQKNPGSTSKLAALMILVGFDQGLATEQKIQPGQARLMSPTGLLEASIFRAMIDSKTTALTADEAARLIQTYRTAIRDRTPVATAVASAGEATRNQLTFSTAAVQVISPMLNNKLTLQQALPAPALVHTPSAVTARIATPSQAGYQRLIDELIILNNGKNDDGKAADSLRQSGLLEGKATVTMIDGRTARALAAEALSLSANDPTQIDLLRRKIAGAFSGRNIPVQNAETFDFKTTLQRLEQAKRTAPRRD